MIKNKNFYPTPDDVIDGMIDKLKGFSEIQYILEPSAGKGNIIARYMERYKNRYLKHSSRMSDVTEHIFIDCIEQDQILQAILKDKQYNLIWDDFLTYEATRYYDLIIMNPPFDNGAGHLLKAIEIQERIGGKILCLLNAETLKNPYSNKRKELISILEKYNAEIEYKSDSFSNSERSTSVEIASIYINVPMKDNKTLFQKEVEEMDEINFNINELNSPTLNLSRVEQLVIEYNYIKK